MQNSAFCPQRVWSRGPVLTLVLGPKSFGHFSTLSESKPVLFPLVFSSPIHMPCTLLDYQVSPLMFSLASLAGCHFQGWIPSPGEEATAVCPMKGPSCLLCTKQKKTSVNRCPNCPYGRLAKKGVSKMEERGKL